MRNVVGLRSCDIITGDFSHTLLVLHAMFGINKQIFEYTKPFSYSGGRVVMVEFTEIVIGLQTGAGICAVLTNTSVQITPILRVKDPQRLPLHGIQP